MIFGYGPSYFLKYINSPLPLYHYLFSSPLYFARLYHYMYLE